MLGMLMVAVLAQGAGGEPPNGEAAEAVMRAFFDDVAAERWIAAAARFHPEALERFRAAALEQAREVEAAPPVEASYPEDMPQAVRDWFEEQRAEREEEGHDTQWAEPPWLVRDTVEALTPVELMARMLEHRDPRTEMRRAMRAGGAPPDQDGLVQYTRMRNRVVGSVEAEAGEAFVLYHTGPRLDGPFSPFSSLAVATLGRSGGEWRIWSHVNQAAVGWMGNATMVYDAGPPGAAPDTVFRWPGEGDPTLTVNVEGPGSASPAIRLEIRGPEGEARVVMPPDAVDSLIEYLVLTNAGLARESGAR